MDFACPHCAESLAESMPRRLPGSFWSLQRNLICPHCASPLTFNWHPCERWVQGILLALICCAVMLDYWSGDVRWLLILGGVAFLGELLFMGWSARNLAAWPRYLRKPDKTAAG